MKLKTLLFTTTLLFITILSAQKISKKEGVYVDKKGNKYSGIYISYYQENIKEAVYSIKNGIENGSVEFYYPSTEIMEQGSFKDGLKHGKWVRWSVNGNKLAEASYNKGTKEGQWLIWDELGTKRYEMYYTKGIKTGTWIMWDEKGQISNKKEY